jgi:hypothetical protein
VRPVVVLLVLARAAFADGFLDGHVSVKLAGGLVKTSSATAVADSGNGRLTLVVTSEPHGAAGDLRELLAKDPEISCAPITRSGASAYAAMPVFPLRIGDRAVVLLVDARGLDGTLVSLRFFVDSAGLDHAERWAAVARAIAVTLQLRVH